MKRAVQLILLLVITIAFWTSPVEAQIYEGLPTATPTPFLGANWKTTWKTEHQGHQLYFYWTPIPGAKGYNITVSKKAGASPSEKIKTTQTNYTFKSVSPGQWYVNLIAQQKDGTWTEPAFWTVDLEDPNATEEAKMTADDVSVTPVQSPEVLSVKTKVQNIIRSLTGAPTPEPQTGIRGNYTCNCEKTCRSISSCSEAYFQLNTCGCVSLDADDNGIPCENKCGATKR